MFQKCLVNVEYKILQIGKAVPFLMTHCYQHSLTGNGLLKCEKVVTMGGREGIFKVISARFIHIVMDKC